MASEKTHHDTPSESRPAVKALMTNALLVALVALVTSFIRIPTPITRGYVNLGDIIVIMAGFLLGGPRGALVGGLGSALADFMGGYMLYVPGTLVIKGLEGYMAGLIGHWLNPRRTVSLRILGGCVAGSIMAGGYFCYEAALMGTPAAMAALTPNLVQGAVGIIGALAVYPALAARVE